MTRRMFLAALAVLIAVPRERVPQVPEYLRRGAPLTPRRMPRGLQDT